MIGLKLGPFAPFRSNVVPTPYTSVHYRCLLAVQSQIQALNLVGVASDSIIVRKLPWARDFEQGNLNFPGIIVSPFGAETMNANEGTNRRDDVGYPVFVSILASDNQDLESNLGLYLRWREAISRYFRNQPLAGVDEVYTCRVEPGLIVLPAAFDSMEWVSSILFRFISRELRGTATWS